MILFIHNYFNPIIGLILTMIKYAHKTKYTNFNPIIGLILTIQCALLPFSIAKFQSHYRSDFNPF